MTPLNCPIPFSANRPCGECGDNWGGNCNYYLHSPVPVNSRLTDSERLQALESYRDKKENSRGEGGGTLIYNKSDTVQRGEFLFLQRKVNEHLDKSKSRLEDGY